jgi:hypothetical protein
VGGGGNIIDTLEATLTANNYTGPLDVIFQQRTYFTDKQELGSGIPILWSNTTSPSGGLQLGIIPSGSGILRITDGWSGLGHIFYSPGIPTDWAAPIPSNIDSALDALVKATGILAGGTGNPPRIIDPLAETLNAGNWSSIIRPVFETGILASGSVDFASGVNIRWSSTLSPSGFPYLSLVPYSSGILRIGDGSSDSGKGHLLYIPGVPTHWGAPVPENVTLALDALVKATGILAGGTGNPPTTQDTANIAMNLLWVGW